MTDFVIENGVLEKYTGEESKVVIPDSVTEIGECAFRCCRSLKEITIPDSVTEIGKYAFRNCKSLEKITIPSSVIKIGNYAFDGCEDLVIKAPENSYAQKYAEENNIKSETV